MSLEHISALVIVITAVIWVVWDIYAVIKGGTKATLSNVVTKFSWYSPSLPFIFGALVGHWFL